MEENKSFDLGNFIVSISSILILFGTLIIWYKLFPDKFFENFSLFVTPIVTTITAVFLYQTITITIKSINLNEKQNQQRFLLERVYSLENQLKQFVTEFELVEFEYLEFSSNELRRAKGMEAAMFYNQYLSQYQKNNFIINKHIINQPYIFKIIHLFSLYLIILDSLKLCTEKLEIELVILYNIELNFHQVGVNTLFRFKDIFKELHDEVENYLNLKNYDLELGSLPELKNLIENYDRISTKFEINLRLKEQKIKASYFPNPTQIP